jgi:hypothetical protein
MLPARGIVVDVNKESCDSSAVWELLLSYCSLQTIPSKVANVYTQCGCEDSEMVRALM